MSRKATTRAVSLAYVQRPLSQSWRAAQNHREAGWVITPKAAGDVLTEIVANAFSRFLDDLARRNAVLPDSLLLLIERAEEELIERLCAAANGWMKARMASTEESAVIAPDEAAKVSAEIIEAVFTNVGAATKEFDLISESSPQDKLFMLDLRYLARQVFMKVTNSVNGWK
jgi:hypothetical protein